MEICRCIKSAAQHRHLPPLTLYVGCNAAVGQAAGAHDADGGQRPLLQHQALGPAAPHPRGHLRGVLHPGGDWARRVTGYSDYEFLTQGDIELAHGRLPVPIMNRVCSNDQALHQVPAALQHCMFSVANVVPSCHCHRQLTVNRQKQGL